MNIIEKITIDVPPRDLYQLYCDLERWPQVLDDVVSVQLHYADGYHQEFSMTVRRPSGEETVRGVRYCRGRELEMCQFTTPPLLSRMSGRWTFDGPPKGPTTLSAERSFALRDPDGDAEHFAAQLRAFLRANLRAFGKAALDAHR
jgi:hypothetical protein